VPSVLAPGADGADLYLDLLKRVLTGHITLGEELVELRAIGLRRRLYEPFQAFARRRGYRLLTAAPPVDPELRRLGRDWPDLGHTMVGLERLSHLQGCVRAVVADDVPGDLIETGVWRGGASIFMKGALRAYGDERRTVWCADSFQGLPPPTHPRDSHDLSGIPYLEVGEAQVRRNFERYGLLDERVRFLPGWFRDTLPSAPIAALAILRLDGDLYESTTDALGPLYPKLSPGGFVIVDDYFSHPDCAAAVEDYRREHGITTPVEDIDGFGACWRKE
jgi:O-methyltransferase